MLIRRLVHQHHVFWWRVLHTRLACLAVCSLIVTYHIQESGKKEGYLDQENGLGDVGEAAHNSTVTIASVTLPLPRLVNLWLLPSRLRQKK